MTGWLLRSLSAGLLLSFLGLLAACAPDDAEGGDENSESDDDQDAGSDAADAEPDHQHGTDTGEDTSVDVDHDGHGTDVVDHDTHTEDVVHEDAHQHDTVEEVADEPDVVEDIQSDIPVIPDTGPLPDTGDEPEVPEFGDGAPDFAVIGDASDDLDVPRDLAFHPERPDELWTVNQADDSTVIFFDPGTGDQESEYRKDVMANHFMEEVSSMAFGANDTFATCQESRNTYDHETGGNDFMGPALWPADLDIYAEVNQSPSSPLLGSHIDMLHQSPYCMGIAHDHDNVYWVFDGFNREVVYYDFAEDHGPGYDDHSDGIVRRYPQAALTRLANVPGHLILDQETGWLYVADTGAGRILRLDVDSGEVVEELDLTNEDLAEYSEMGDATVQVFTYGLDEPSGLALHDGRLFVSDHGTGEIIAYDLSGHELGRLETPAVGIMGLEVGPEGDLWYADGAADEIVHITP